MKCTLAFQIICFILFNKQQLETEATMTLKQMEAATRLIRSTCQPRAKATNEDIDGMHKGNWNIDHSAMCYMACAMNMNKLFNKDNTLNYELGLSMVNKHLPEPFKSATLKAMDHCRNAAKTLNDQCVVAYELAKCFYDFSPENYFLP